MIDLQLALQAAIRQGEHNAQALIDTALVVRDLRASIRAALFALERGHYASARKELKQALDEMPVEQRRRERE
jgi:hypothetical protein